MAAAFQPSYDTAKLPGTAPDAPDLKFYGEPSPSGSEFGNVVRTGDFNGDGIQDLAILDPFVERSAPFRALVGAVYIWYGRTGFAGRYDAKGVAGPAPDVKIVGAKQGDRIGMEAAFEVGDLNGDGVDDFVIGARSASDPSGTRPYCGMVYVVFGRKAPNPLPTLVDLAAPDDGGADVTIIGPSEFAALSQDNAIRLADVNGDGVQDLILGAQFANRINPSATGEAYVIYGHKSPDAHPKTIDLARVGTNEGADVTLRGVTGWDILTVGGTLAVGDVNGDQLSDIIVGAPNGEILESPDRHGGRVCVVFGRAAPEGLPPFIDLSKQGPGGADVTILGGYPQQVGDRTIQEYLCGSGGLQVADINGDKVLDLVLRSAHGVYIVLGRKSFPPVLDMADEGPNGPDLRLADTTPILKYLGSALGVGDLNGDGMADIALANGSLKNRVGKDQAGQAVVVLGSQNSGGSVKLRNLDADGSAGVDLRVYGADESDQLFYAAFGNAPGHGDVNGDQIDDLVLVSIGASGPGEGRPRGGEAYLQFGRANVGGELDLAQPGKTGERVVIYGPAAFAEFFLRSGDTVIRRPGVRIADINGDGVGDLILSNGGVNTPFGELRRPNVGEVYVILGIRTTTAEAEINVEDSAGLAMASGDARTFGLVSIGTSTPLRFTIRNSGAATLSGIGASLDGADSSSFTVTSTPDPFVEGPAGSTSFTVAFSPSSPGPKTAILHLASNDADENPFNIV
ncbi:MAG: FG-GAP repeat protein, partial [Verrucomicrobiales bacterium]|nr:FG-GAP repeat protein [Verrucomicrobiales bacterium]